MTGTPRMRARCKTGFVTARTGAVTHVPARFEAAWDTDGSIHFYAGFLCGNMAHDVVILASAEDVPAMCAACEDAAKGPRVYRCFNSDGILLYIGSTTALVRRTGGHKSESPWWPEVADITEEPYPTVFQARAAERLAIKAERPIHNDQYNKGAA